MAIKVLKVNNNVTNSFLLSLLKKFISVKNSHINENTHNIRYGEYGGYEWNGYEGFKGTVYTSKKEIYFYEWSDLTKEPKTFTTRNAFRAFLMKSNIPTTKELESRIDDGSDLYACCKKNSKEVIFSYSKYSLGNQLEGKYTYNYNDYAYQGHYECWD